MRYCTAAPRRDNLHVQRPLLFTLARTSLLLGVVSTVAIAWFAHPVVSAALPRLAVFEWRLWPADPIGQAHGIPASVRFGRATFVDAWQLRTEPPSLGAQPVADGRVEQQQRPPLPLALALPDAERNEAWRRVDTRLSGWPARAFADEAWFAGNDPAPAIRWGLRLGADGARSTTIPLRPIWSGFIVNVVFWASLVFFLSHATRVLRSWRRHAHMHTAGPTDGVAAASTVASSAVAVARPLSLAAPEMRYQSEYVWLVFVSSLDIMLTWAILQQGGEEVNPVADLVIAMWGLHGAIAFKFALMLFVIVSCEIIGRKSDRAGFRLAIVAVGISAFPVVYSLGLLLDHIVLRPVR